MEPEKTRQPLPTKKKQHASQQINPSPPTAARPQHRTIPRRAPSIRYANRRIHTKIRTATPAAIAPHHRSTPTPSESKTSELQNHSGGRKTRLHAHRARRAGPDTRHETSHAIPIPHHLHQIGNADIEKISTSRRWKRSPTIWRHGEPVPMRNVANTMRRSRGWRHPEPD